MYNALQAHQETKNFESYLLIQNRIQNECKNGLKETLLLQKLTKVFKTGGKEQDLMKILQLVETNFAAAVYIFSFKNIFYFGLKNI